MADVDVHFIKDVGCFTTWLVEVPTVTTVVSSAAVSTYVFQIT